MIREPNPASVEVAVDGSTVCTDTQIGSGVSNQWLLDTSGWASGTHEVTLTLTTGAGLSYSNTVPYEGPV